MGDNVFSFVPRYQNLGDIVEKGIEDSVVALQLNEGDTVYIFSDGYADQFGGPRGKKMKYKTLKNFLIEAKNMPMTEVKELLINKFNDWKGDLEQLDDVCIIGVRF